MASFSESPDEGRDRRNLYAAGTFLLLAVMVLYLPPSIQGQVAAGLRATVLRPFILTQEALALVRLRAENAASLQAQLDSLAGALVSQGPLVEENRRLRELLQITDTAEDLFVPARVLRPGTEGSESMFLLDVGSDQGVEPGDPVLMREGGVALAGVVKETRRGSSIGIDWSHPDFRASAMTEDGRVYGLVEPVRGTFREEDRLLLNGIPFYERLETGTRVTTSGLGGVFPRGIPIGTVEALAEQEARWRKAYWLRPLVPTGSVTHVLVVVGSGVGEGLMRLFEEGRGGEGSGEGGGE